MLEAKFVYKKIKDFNPKTGSYELVEKWILNVKENENSEPITFYYSTEKEFLKHLKMIDKQNKNIAS